jgi:ribosome-binding protein aMBF1 (putative translation factor)
MSARPKLIPKPQQAKQPKLTRHELAQPVAEQIQKIVREGRMELEMHQQRIQERVNAGVSALCGLEAARLSLTSGSWKLSEDLKALEVAEEK